MRPRRAQWYPMPRDYPDPFGPAAREPNMSWHRSYKLRYQRQYYPNSGLLMGTAAGFEALAAAIKAVPQGSGAAYHQVTRAARAALEASDSTVLTDAR